MTQFLVMALAFLAVYGIYLAALVARQQTDPAAFLDGGASLPGWAVSFGAAGVMVAGIGLGDHLTLMARFGLQASHVALGLVLAALTAVLVQKRLWLAARITGIGSPGAALADYYGSVTLRIFLLILAGLFALPFAANQLSTLGGLLAEVTAGAIPRATSIWVIAFFLLLPAVIGGWRATVLILALQTVLIAVLLIATTGFAGLVLPGSGFLAGGIPTVDGNLADRIPGVIQFSAGIGKETPPGGIFTTVGIASGALALIGVVLSPGFLYLGMTARAGKAHAFAPVWLIAGLACGLLLLVAPFLVAHLAGGLVALATTLAAIEPFAGLGLLLLALVTGQVAVAFFTTSGALMITRELVLPLILPGLSARNARLTARIALALCFWLVATLAAFAPLLSAILASLALPLAVQLLPAVLGLAFVPWISRSAVLVGLILGALVVFFTEPPGLILFEGLWLDLPWGRWPLTVHSAAWGLACNIAAVLLVAIFTRAGPERLDRDRLHTEFAANRQIGSGGGAGRGAKGSLTLIWAFLAIGPGAILGNTFFSQPVFTQGEAALGLPSLWVWQILFWLIGVLLVWWLAYPSRLGITEPHGLRPLTPFDVPGLIGDPSTPGWIAAGLARVAGR